MVNICNLSLVKKNRWNLRFALTAKTEEEEKKLIVLRWWDSRKLLRIVLVASHAMLLFYSPFPSCVGFESLEDASKLFDQMPLTNTVSFVTLAQGFSRSHQFQRARRLLLRYASFTIPTVSYLPVNYLLVGTIVNQSNKVKKLSFSQNQCPV